MSKINEFAENSYRPNGDTIRAIEKQKAFIEGLNIGAEFAEWVFDNDWKPIPDNRWHRIVNPQRPESQWEYEYLTKPELIELFLDEKMKQDEKEN